ncbi:iron-sulfur cluster biosynthesis family protein [Aquibacillus koreensis]|uniref:Iron-sulfur cluster biosynthesis family protein n=1 Tax=Aquibacillus koreensis TaxID=279446 RepID=A0A9X3WI44_9BACI|nr:iron-sulfur cluster biosynthesis family protein [Aquibacillus koreensis]MCT2537459.1 iron-sulfur cluster biosynthesis family protein [Aquibacillus koreensis]MDC3418905.1 iron-sulfur cluster biosynthesis family protein [Aquibacillus koreensis]
MKLTITNKALEKVREISDVKDKYIWLYYDTDDCGCGVNGLPTIRLTETTGEAFESVENQEFHVIVHKQQAVFFAENITLDYVGNTFRLTSPEGILNPIIPVQDLIKGVEV